MLRSERHTDLHNSYSALYDPRRVLTFTIHWWDSLGHDTVVVAAGVLDNQWSGVHTSNDSYDWRSESLIFIVLSCLKSVACRACTIIQDHHTNRSRQRVDQNNFNMHLL